MVRRFILWTRRASLELASGFSMMNCGKDVLVCMVMIDDGPERTNVGPPWFKYPFFFSFFFGLAGSLYGHSN